jgi:Mg2+/Co2+ transporter CorC
MKELSKFFSIYSHENHKKWAELLQYIEGSLNKTVASSTGYSPLELMFGCSKPSVFDIMLPKPKQNALDVEELDTILEQAFSKMKRKAAEREKKKKERKC